MQNPTAVRLALTAALVSAAGGASAHPSLAPHAHPHGETLILGLDQALLAAAAVAVIAVAGVLVGRARAAATRRRS